MLSPMATQRQRLQGETASPRTLPVRTVPPGMPRSSRYDLVRVSDRSSDNVIDVVDRSRTMIVGYARTSTLDQQAGLDASGDTAMRATDADGPDGRVRALRHGGKRETFLRNMSWTSGRGLCHSGREPPAIRLRRPRSVPSPAGPWSSPDFQITQPVAR